LGYLRYTFVRDMNMMKADAQCTAVAKSLVEELYKSERLNTVVSGYPIDPIMKRLTFSEYGDLVLMNASGVPVDPWGHPLSAEVVAEGEWLLVEIGSPGPDGRFKSADDVFRRERLRKVLAIPET